MTRTISKGGVTPPLPVPLAVSAPHGRLTQAAIYVTILAVLGVLAFGLLSASKTQLQSGPAPDFTLSLFDGGALRLSDLRGKIVVVNIWASWCVPCKDEAPFLERAWRAYRERGVVFVGADYVDTEPAARAFLTQFGVTYPNGPDIGSAIYRAYRGRGVPETYFVDRDGIIARVQIGPLTEPLLTTILNEMLTKQ